MANKILFICYEFLGAHIVVFDNICLFDSQLLLTLITSHILELSAVSAETNNHGVDSVFGLSRQEQNIALFNVTIANIGA